ncbi:MAG: gamma-glutamylcyclotransferase family protein [Candidatus Pacearchaeota archaeon]
MYYFAYGSNMNQEQMIKRCKGKNFKFIGRAYLKGYRFVYDGQSEYRGGAVANIVKSENDIVWGVLYEINKNCLKNLDKYEGYPYVYNRKEVEVITDDGYKFLAWVYLREPKPLGKPSDKYRKVVLEGAKACNLPEDYIRKFL